MLGGNPYAILGVSSRDSMDVIQKKYRQLCRKYHPDNIVSGDSKKFMQINEAWKSINSCRSSRPSNLGMSIWRHKTLFKLQRAK